MANPYVSVHKRIEDNRGWRAQGVLPVVAAALVTPLVGPVLMPFLPAEGAPAPEALAYGMSAIGFRLAAVVAGAVLLRSYADLVRGSDRAVLDVHPIRPRELVVAIARRTTRESVYLPVMVAVLLAPVALAGHYQAWGAGTALAVSAWLGALGVGFAVHLGSVWAASSPAMAQVLDLVRGATLGGKEGPKLPISFLAFPFAALAGAFPGPGT